MIYLILGRREQGKTTLGLWMLRRGQAARAIFDPRGLIAPMAGGTRIETIDDIPIGFAALSGRSITELIYTPEFDVRPAFEIFAGELAAWVRDDRTRALRVLVDEAGFAPLDTSEFLWLLRCSRRDRVDVVITAHRPADIPTDVRAIVDHWLIFPMRQEHDLRVITERCGSPVAQRVSELPDHWCVHWDDSRSTAQLLSDPTVWYLDMEALANGR